VTENVQAPAGKSVMQKVMVIAFLGIPYIAIVCVCLFFLTILPNETGAYQSLIVPATIIALSSALAILFLLLLLAKHIIKAPNIAPNVKLSSIAKAALFYVPGILLTGYTAIAVNLEPGLYLEITSPTTSEEIIAPVAVTFSADKAAKILQLRNLTVLQYEWDFDGDRQADVQASTLPEATHVYKRQGIYTATAVLTLQNGEKRVVSRAFSIPKATISYEPPDPIVDSPVVLSVAHLFTEEQPVSSVQWNFGDDNEETKQEASVIHAYTRDGTYTVTAVATMANNIQQTFTRTITIGDPPPLPFPISITTKPDILISPAPFSVEFSVETEEPLDSIVWTNGNAPEVEGKVARYTFASQGDFTVNLNAESTSGKRVKLAKLVRIVPELQLNDLTFSGSPEITANKLSIEGELPVRIDLTPKTVEQPFVEFTWEAPDASSVASTKGSLQAIYRHPGTYSITLLAQHPEGRAKRYIIPVIVKPRSDNVTIAMNKTGGEAPLEILFDASETYIPNEEISGFTWKYGDNEDEVPQPGGAVTRYVYNKPGTFTVELTATTTSGKVFTTNRVIVVRPPILSACFTASRSQGSAPMGVIFSTSCTTGIPKSYRWNFGDGQTSNDVSPTHVFKDPGIYTVELEVRDQYDTMDKESFQITVYEPS
jgi:PKD repeat protein